MDTFAVIVEGWGRSLRAARETRGLTQAGLADLAGCTQQTIDRIERGATVPRDRLKADLAGALQVPAGDLFAWPN